MQNDETVVRELPRELQRSFQLMLEHDEQMRGELVPSSILFTFLQSSRHRQPPSVSQSTRFRQARPTRSIPSIVALG